MLIQYFYFFLHFHFSPLLFFLFNLKNKFFPVIIINSYMFLWSYFGANTINLEKIFFTHPVCIVSIFAQYVVPLILLLGFWINARKEKRLKGVKYEKTETSS